MPGIFFLSFCFLLFVSYKQEVEEEGGSGDRPVSEKLSAGEREGWNSPQPCLLLPLETHSFYVSLFKRDRKVGSVKSVVIPLLLWMWSSVLFCFLQRESEISFQWSSGKSWKHDWFWVWDGIPKPMRNGSWRQHKVVLRAQINVTNPKKSFHSPLKLWDHESRHLKEATNPKQVRDKVGQLQLYFRHVRKWCPAAQKTLTHGNFRWLVFFNCLNMNLVFKYVHEYTVYSHNIFPRYKCLH